MKNETDNFAFEDCTFKITTTNEMMLRALIKYSMMLDFVTNAQGEDMLNVDGLINSIMSEGMTRRIKELVKRHGFDDAEEFMDVMTSCSDGEEVSVEIKNRERIALQKMHDEILSHIPLDDKQKSLSFS